MATTIRLAYASTVASATPDYVLDFGLIKRLTKEIADRLDERTIIRSE
jgi:6-pyruvoyl-tetrahydropterin synthase